jgi:hypothetical protein
MDKLTPAEIQELAAQTGEQISFRADIDVLAWITRARKDGYTVKGYIQRLIRDDMERAGIASTTPSTPKRPKVVGADASHGRYVPLPDIA